jgi:hypothetical protein
VACDGAWRRIVSILWRRCTNRTFHVQRNLICMIDPQWREAKASAFTKIQFLLCSRLYPIASSSWFTSSAEYCYGMQLEQRTPECPLREFKDVCIVSRRMQHIPLRTVCRHHNSSKI